jgi:ATP-dependent helicase/nuclease subunit B
MGITRRFLGWDRPVLDLVADELLASAPETVLDLSHLLVVVPTRNAGRRLRETLAHLAHLRDRAIAPPQVVPPDFLFSLISDPDPSAGHLASPQEALLGWISTLRECDLEEFRALFPVPPAQQDFSWALATARGLTDLRQTLGEAGLAIADVVTLLAGDLEEEDRWQELARLERRFLKRLAAHGVLDLLTVRKDQALTPEIPAGVSRIVVAACPDPLPLAVDILGALASLVPVETWIHAPDDLASAFDAWGRPSAEFWRSRHLVFPGTEPPVRVCPDAEAQAEVAAAAVLACENPAATITVGVIDPAVTPALERRLSEAGQPTFNPSGSSLRSRGLVHLLRVLRELEGTGSFHAFLEFLRCPDVEGYLATCLLVRDTHRLFERFDALHRRHLFPDLAGLRQFLGRGRPVPGELSVEQVGALEEVEKLLARLRRPPHAEAAGDVLEDLLGSRLRFLGEDVEACYRAAADAVQPVLDALAGPLGRETDPGPSEVLTLLLQAVEQVSLYEERPAASVELLGWLELHWDDAPHLVLAGCNDGFVPESLVGDVYLPERLRRKLAARLPFPTNDSRQARDTYLCEALFRAREQNGRVDLLLGKRSSDGAPLRPSRLLFRCPDEELPARVDLLFREPPKSDPDLPWTPGFLLTPRPGVPEPPPPALDTLPVTAFRAYLESPFGFYLRHVEQMQPVDGEARELDAAVFGSFLHEVLRRFAQDRDVRHETDAAAIQDFLLHTATTLSREWFGPTPPLPVRIQLDAACQRLARAAEVQAATRREGWMILDSEVDLDRHHPLEISGTRITGRIDRIDRHEGTGEIRILDYKTGDEPAKPEPAHLARLRSGSRRDWLPDYARFTPVPGKGEARWKDLQLPLYRLGVDPSLGNRITCGYFNLPKAVSRTEITVWDRLDETHDDAAWRCAAGVLADIRAGRFWPAGSEAATADPAFRRFHLGMPERTVDHRRLLPSEDAP